jgi:hypothetical protein
MPAEGGTIMRTSLALKGVAAALLVATMFAVWTSVPAVSAARGETQVVVNVTEGPFVRFVDVGKGGFSPGDVVMEDQPVSDPTSGDQLGRAISSLQFVRLFKGGDGITLLDTTLVLADGSITIHGPVRLSELDGTSVVRFAVVGGTGVYGSAIGEAVLRHDEGSEIYEVSVDLTTP